MALVACAVSLCLSLGFGQEHGAEEAVCSSQRAPQETQPQRGRANPLPLLLLLLLLLLHAPQPHLAAFGLTDATRRTAGEAAVSRSVSVDSQSVAALH